MNYFSKLKQLLPGNINVGKTLQETFGSIANIISGEKSFLDADRLATLLCEYRVTLSFEDIATMRALLCAWLLLKSKDSTVIGSVLGEIGRLPYGGLQKGVYAPEQANDVARAILAHLTQNDRVRLRSVVYRTESERRMLDRILQL